jgi:hypothetical protein
VRKNVYKYWRFWINKPSIIWLDDGIRRAQFPCVPHSGLRRKETGEIMVEKNAFARRVFGVVGWIAFFVGSISKNLVVRIPLLVVARGLAAAVNRA